MPPVASAKPSEPRASVSPPFREGPGVGSPHRVALRITRIMEQDSSMRASCTQNRERAGENARETSRAARLSPWTPALHGRQQGQSLIVAVIVMFVLLFIGAIFVGLVARNLLNSGRARDTVEAAQFAEAGIQYADNFLRNSPEGADWRPAVVPVANVNPNDPDKRWLNPPDGSPPFSRIS